MHGAAEIVTALRRSVSFHLPKYFSAKTLPSGTQWRYDYCPAGARIVSGDSPPNCNLLHTHIERKEKNMGISASAPWTKYYGNTPASLDYPHTTMYQQVAATAKKYPDSTAYVFMGKKTTYSAFMKRIEAAAKGLYNMGIRKGDRVTICMANTPQALDCFYALNRIGAIPNMIHPLSAAKEIAGDEAAMVSLGQAISYPFGVVGVVLFVQIMPKILKADMAKERALIAAPVEKKEVKTEAKVEKKNTLDSALSYFYGTLKTVADSAAHNYLDIKIFESNGGCVKKDTNGGQL